MPKLQLTEKTISRLRAPHASGRQALFWDKELRGFGVLVSGKTTARTYIAQREVDGRTRRVTIAAVAETSLKDAREQAAATLLEMRRGIDPKAGRRGGMTLRAALDAYIAARSTLKPKTAKNYRDAVEHYLADWLDLPIVRRIDADMVEARFGSIRDQVAAQGRYRGEVMANYVCRVLGALWVFAADREPRDPDGREPALPRNPVARLKRQWFRVPRRERLVRADDLPAFYKAVCALPNPVARDYLLLLLFTGLRRTEAATLTWDDVDFGAKLIRIPAARTKAGRKLDLPMTDVVRDLLVARRALGRERFVFPSVGKTGHITEPKNPLQEVARATGIRVSAHDLRRTFVTVAESCDISPLALKGLVNHTLGGDVTAGYVQMNVERLCEPAQKVGDRLKQLCGIEAPEGVALHHRA
jgi:integrase